MAARSILKTMKLLGVIAVLLAVAVVVTMWLGRDRIAIAMSNRELRQRQPLEKVPLPVQDVALLNELRAYLETHHQSPEAYILGKFDDHDIVFVGEHHRIKHDVELIQRLIPRLYERGVRNLGFEFADREDQSLIDGLVTGETYDEQLANLILFNSSVMWGYQEYADVFKAAWEVNHDLPEDASKFRIVALNVRRDWSHVMTAEDRDDAEILDRVWGGRDGEEAMAETMLREIVDRNEQALIYCGIHHAFTRYKQPWGVGPDGGVLLFDRRMGHLVFNEIGERAVTIALHTSWPGEGADVVVHPVDGVIDALMNEVPTEHRRAGFDTRGTPFGELAGGRTGYARGHDDFVLADFCDGYVFEAPFTEYENVTPIPGFINRRNIREAKRRAASSMFRTGLWRYLGPDFMNHLIGSEGNVEDRFAMFE